MSQKGKATPMTGRERLVLYYSKHQPDNLHRVDEILELYAGDLDAISSDLQDKYGEGLFDVKEPEERGRGIFGSTPLPPGQGGASAEGAKDFLTVDTRSGLWQDSSPEVSKQSGKPATPVTVRDPSVGGIHAMGLGGGSLSGSSGRDLSVRECLILYYKKHNPSQLANVDKLVEDYAGATDALSDDLKAKYGESLYAVSKRALSAPAPRVVSSLDEGSGGKRHPYLQMLEATPEPRAQLPSNSGRPRSDSLQTPREVINEQSFRSMTIITEEVPATTEEQTTLVRLVEGDATAPLAGGSADVLPVAGSSSSPRQTLNDLRWADQSTTSLQRSDGKASSKEDQTVGVSHIAFSPSRRHNLDLHGHLFALRRMRESAAREVSSTPNEEGTANQNQEQSSVPELPEGPPQGFDQRGYLPLHAASPTSSSRYVAAATSMLYAKQDAARQTISATASQIFRAAQQSAGEKIAPIPRFQLGRAAPSSPAAVHQQSLNVDLATSFQEARRSLEQQQKMAAVSSKSMSFVTPARRTLDSASGHVERSGGLYMPAPSVTRHFGYSTTEVRSMIEERVRLQHRVAESSPMVRDALLRNPDLVKVIDSKVAPTTAAGTMGAGNESDEPPEATVDVICVKCGCVCKQRIRDGAVLFHH